MATDTVLITGNTYPVKDQLKALGGRWDAAAKGWRVPATKAGEARALVGDAPASTGRTQYRGRRSSSWENREPCGYPGCRGYGDPLCDDCG